MDAKQLRRFRKRLEVNQDEFASMLGYSLRNYSKMEAGSTNIRASVSLACAAMAMGTFKYNEDHIMTLLDGRLKRRK